MTKTIDSTRRVFLKSGAAASSGLVLGFALPVSRNALAQGGAATEPEVNAWVVIKPDDTVVVRIARSEMGQGTLTGLAQLVAEELECDWSKVTTEYPTPGQNLARKRVWGNFSTGGSRGIRDSHELVRKGGAAARMVLVQAAANGWGVPASECVAAKSVITHRASGRSTSYGKVANSAAKLPVPSDVPLKDPKNWTIAGKPMPRLDTREKTNGEQVYGMDLKLPGMLNAAMRDCPYYGGKVKSFDASAALARPGVRKVVPVGETGVAVIADTWWRAKTALDAVKVEWDKGPNAAQSSAAFQRVLQEALNADSGAVANSNGDAKAALQRAARRIEAEYSYPHQNHACMETMNATVRWTPERCEGWVPTQNGESALAALAAAAGLQPSQCDVHKMHLGGGFGRRGMGDYVTKAVQIARQMPGVPVKMIWSREEDMIHGRFHPVTHCKLTAGLDAQGNIESLHMRLAGQSILAQVFPQNVRDGLDPVMFQGLNKAGPEASIGYSFPNLLVDHVMRNPPVPVGFWRGVNLNQNAIYLECFLDEIAHATKQDPLALRRKLMAQHPKHLAVLNAVAAKVGWGTTPPPAGVHRGLAQIMGFGSYVAACAEVSVSAKGDLKIHRIVAATDPGHAVNPQQIAAQVEGSFAYGLSAALYQACTLKDGLMEQTNFDTYPVMRIDAMPKVETLIVSSGGFWGGVGEPTIAVAAPAVLNAIFAATGKRIRHLPLRGQNLV